MNATPWTSHTSRGSFKPSEHVGELLLISVLSEQEEHTMNGPAMTVRANITVLTGPEAGTANPNVTLFGAPIVRDLLGTVGATRLARIGTAPSRTPGLNPAVFLSEPQDGDDEIARKAWAAHERAYTAQKAPWASQPPQAAPAAPEAPQAPAKAKRAPAAKKSAPVEHDPWAEVLDF